MDRVTQRLWRGVEEPSVRCSAQDDDFVGGSKASGRDHLPSFNHALLKAVNRLHRQKTPCSANSDSSERMPAAAAVQALLHKPPRAPLTLPSRRVQETCRRNPPTPCWSSSQPSPPPIAWWYGWTIDGRSIRERKRRHQADYIFSSCGESLLANPAGAADISGAHPGAGDQCGRQRYWGPH